MSLFKLVAKSSWRKL